MTSQFRGKGVGLIRVLKIAKNMWLIFEPGKFLDKKVHI